MSRTARLGTILMSCLALLLTPGLTGTAQATPTYSSVMADEAYWISLSQISNSVSGAGHGALAWYPDTGTRKVRPYIANRGAAGMLLGGSYYYPMVKAYVDWYFRHVNGGTISGLPNDYNPLSGTVYDYDVTVSTGAETYGVTSGQNTPGYDSTDAYAGTFLTLLRKWAALDSTAAAYLQARTADIEKIAQASVATLGANGLTGARPDAMGQYGMDNIEVEQGLTDYIWLLQNTISNPTVLSYWQGQDTTMRNGIYYNLWSTSKSMYCWASDACATTAWSNFYSSAVTQAWPIISGVAAGRAPNLWTSFNTNYPNWTTSANNPDGFPWAILAVAAGVRGSKTQVDAYLNGSQTQWINTGRPWPWNIADSADRARAAQLASAL